MVFDRHTKKVPLQGKFRVSSRWKPCYVREVIGKAQQIAFQPEKVALMIAGPEVRHVHLHLIPIWDLYDLDFANAAREPDPASLDLWAAQIRAALRDLGRTEVTGT